MSQYGAKFDKIRYEHSYCNGRIGLTRHEVLYEHPAKQVLYCTSMFNVMRSAMNIAYRGDFIRST
jgi:predicted fused transcriptional regulator/phosphomethylpyrimidine kinase